MCREHPYCTPGWTAIAACARSELVAARRTPTEVNFPPRFAAPVVRQDLLAQDPAIADVLNRLGGRIDDATMANLDLQVDQEGREVPEVAAEFLAHLQATPVGSPAASPIASPMASPMASPAT